MDRNETKEQLQSILWKAIQKTSSKAEYSKMNELSKTLINLMQLNLVDDDSEHTHFEAYYPESLPSPQLTEEQIRELTERNE